MFHDVFSTDNKIFKINIFFAFIILSIFSLNIEAQINNDLIPDFGARFESFTGKIPRQDVKINCMDSDGTFVYLGTESHGLLKIKYINNSPGNVYVNQHGSFADSPKIKVKDYELVSSNNRLSIPAITLDATNHVWCGTKLSCFLKDTKNPSKNELKRIRLDKYIKNPNTVNPNAINTCITTSGNMTFIGTEHGQIIDYNKKTGQFNTDGYKFEDRSSTNGLIAEDGRLVIMARDNGLYSRNKNQWFKNKDIRKAYKVIKTDDGTYWTFGEDNKGKLVVSRSTDRIKWDSFNKNLRCVALENTTINDITIDKAGRNLWIATDNGIMQFNFKLQFCNWYYTNKYPELKMKKVNSLAIQNDSTIWASNYAGELYKLNIYPDTYEEEYLEKLKNVRENKLDPAELAQNLQKKEVPPMPTKTPEPPVVTKEEPVTKVKSSKFSRKKQSLLNLEDIVCGETYELSDLFFIKNTAKFISHAKANDYLSILVTYLETNPKINIELYGHTDFLSNNKEFLYKLSTNRVETVKDFLVDNGIKKRRIKTTAFGGDKPIITDRVTKDRNQNRRVEVKIDCD